MDIANLQSLDTNQLTSEVVFLEETKTTPRVGVIMVGPDSEIYRETLEAQKAAANKRRFSRKAKIDLNTEAGVEEFNEVIEANKRQTCLAVVVGWFGFQNGGVDAPLDKGTLALAYDKFPTWQDMVFSKLDRADDFLTKLQTPQSST